MGITCEKGDALNSLRLCGAIDIALAEELKAALLEALKPGVEVRVDAREATYFDVTAIQLLWATAQEAKLRGVRFGYAEAFPEPLRSALREAGFESLLQPSNPNSSAGESA